MEVHYSSGFKKQYKKLSPSTQLRFKDRLRTFIRNPRAPQLRYHKLHGEYAGLWSINITGDIRAVIDVSHKGGVLFIAIGSHSQLYG
ncbi:type II toxin-antitoxin system mRNA interferase toxin, RelE/StbE family [Candidatus Kaiserbacteria bacterium]|nr:type II toxin-antitoxin system mRNA interferase toxin, RelE/StbE family [Candidatus Kaiserbacteria bacterium]